MFTIISGTFVLSKDGCCADEVLEKVVDCVKEMNMNTYGGESHCLHCDDINIASVKEVSYDTCEEECFKSGITECYVLDEKKNLENSNIIKLKGVHYRVIEFNDLILLNNIMDNSVEYQCKKDEFAKFLESVDEYYETYRKEYTDL